MIRRISCASCGFPYDKPDDDPDPSHPGCAPSEPARFGGVRRYVGEMVAGWWSVCGCGTRIGEGDRQFLRDTEAGARWVCSETCPTVSRPESPAAVSAPVPASRARRAASVDDSRPHGPFPAESTTDETRRAA